MMRLPYLRFILATVVTTIAICGAVVVAAAYSYPGPGLSNAKLWLTASSQKAQAGCPIFLTAHVRNLGKGRIYVPAGPGPLQYFKVKVRYLGHPGPVPWLRAGTMGRQMSINRLVAVLVPPGKSVRFWRKAEINHYFDMSMPGQYATRFAIGRLKSNWVKIRIEPAVVKSQAASILKPSLRGWSHHRGKKRRAFQIRLLQLAQAGKTNPVGVWVYLRASRHGGPSMALTGTRLLDIGAIQVDGPDGYNGDELVKNPKPHYIPIPDHQQVPLTAYGKWLLKHPVTGLKAKRYTLKPGVIYKYAVPINLSCQFDMSLSGNYHVRLRLAHTHIWSAWANVVVPPG